MARGNVCLIASGHALGILLIIVYTSMPNMCIFVNYDFPATMRVIVINVSI